MAPEEGNEDEVASEDAQERDGEGKVEARQEAEIITCLEDQIKTCVEVNTKSMVENTTVSSMVENETKCSEEDMEVVKAVAVSSETSERRNMNLNVTEDDGEAPALDPEPPMGFMEKGSQCPRSCSKASSSP